VNSDNLALEAQRQMLSQYPEKPHDISVAEIWIRANGKCECTSACEHHVAGRCGIAILPQLWSTREILPAWIGTKGMLMREVLCEACRLNPAMQAEISDDFKRANPNWWYRRQKSSDR
jgi:hypothetical protein